MSRRKPDLRDRTRAAVAYVNGRQGSNAEAIQLQAFMDLFHPGHPKTAELVRSTRPGAKS